jgi:Ca2+-binding EF-hand superfamily protein
VLLITSPGEAPPDLVSFMQQRYGSAAAQENEKKLSRKELGLDEATFTRLDTNGDGVLDAQELAGFVKRAPDLELMVRLGRRENSDARIEIVTGPQRSPLADQIRMKDSLAFLDLGVTRVDIGCSDENQPDRLAGFVRDQFRNQFKQADVEGKGFIDEKQAQNNRLLRGLFKAMDRDGDGKVTEKEFHAYLDHLQELSKRARFANVTLVLSDQSRGLFDLLDVNRDGRLSVREMRGAAKLLDQFDRNGKGFLTKADIPRSYQVTLRRGSASTGGAAAAASFLDLYRASSRSEPESPSRGPLWFRKMDRNRDGDVSRKEFLFSEELFRQIDTDGDGLISLEEAERYEALRQNAKPTR